MVEYGLGLLTIGEGALSSLLLVGGLVGLLLLLLAQT